jgi:hypothetical protein
VRARDKVGEALLFVFAIWLASLSTVSFCAYLVAWLALASRGRTLIAFMSENEFAAFFLASFATALAFTALVGLVVWWARGKDARDQGRVERLIDAWVAKLNRSDQ